MFASGCWLSRLAFHPLPNLPLLRGVGEDDEVFMGGFCDLAFDLSANVVVGQPSIACANKCRHPALLCDTRQFKSFLVDRNGERRLMLIPPEFFDEQLRKVEILEEFSRALLFDCH